MSIKQRLEKLEKQCIQIKIPKRIVNIDIDDYNKFREIFIFDQYRGRDCYYARSCNVYKFPSYCDSNINEILRIINKMINLMYRIELFRENFISKYGNPETYPLCFKYNEKYYEFIDSYNSGNSFDFEKYNKEKEYPQIEYPERWEQLYDPNNPLSN